MSIRKEYEELGVAYYYKKYGYQYQNPHEAQVKELLQHNASRMHLGSVLDFAAGGGEVTRALKEKGVDRIQGCDPYTWKLYEQQTGLDCWKYSFKDTIKGKLEGRFDTVISSFALHLCEEEQLYALAMGLFAVAPRLVVISPHKRPDLARYEGIYLEWQDAAYTDKGKAVRMKSYYSWELKALLEAEDKAEHNE